MLAAQRLSQEGLKLKSCTINFMRLCLLVLSKNKRVGGGRSGVEHSSLRYEALLFPQFCKYNNINSQTKTIIHMKVLTGIWALELQVDVLKFTL